MNNRLSVLASTVLLASVLGFANSNPGIGLNPGFSLMTLRPPGFEPQVCGLDFLPNGDMIVLTWRGNDSWPPVRDPATGMDKVGSRPGTARLYRVTNTKGNDINAITAKEIAVGFKDAMGLCVVKGEIYVGDIDRIVKLVDADGDGYYEGKVEIGKLPSYSGWYEYSFGPVYKDGKLYMALAVNVNNSGYPANQFGKDRGTVVSVPIGGGDYSVVAEGLRAPDGIGIGPDGEIFVTDNQGGWRPASQIHHIRQGVFLGYFTEPAGPIRTAVNSKVTPPAVWLPYQTTNDSPSEPAMVTAGTYAGQLIYGDESRGGLYRAFLEKVAGEYQGSVSVFSGGLEVGVLRTRTGPKGEIYIGGLGTGVDSKQGWNGTMFGLQKLVPNGKVAFEILATRSRVQGMELEFTLPVGPSGDSPGNYSVRQWGYVPTADYGGPPQNPQTLAVKSVRLSPDRKRAFLEIDGLKTGQVVDISAKNLSSQDNQNLWSGETWYTLNSISTSAPFEVTVAIPVGKKADPENFLRLERDEGGLTARLPAGDAYRVELIGFQGNLVRSENQVMGGFRIPAGSLPPGIYFLRALGGGTILTKAFCQ